MERMTWKFAVTILVDVLVCSVTARHPLVGVNNGEFPNGGKIWALLTAGSNGYSNYRHQADICHAYQILKSNGIPEENIITMMYDDIAQATDNPTPGIILNKPDGPNVYEGVKIDYSGQNVTPETFLAVLQGNSSAVRNKGSGRVLQSGPNDHIFINFVDHGAPGLLCFPEGNLLASTLESALKSIAEKKRFSKMVLYVEACESGSMFDSILPNDMNIIVLTAADPRESSYACYYDEIRQTYLGDVFSVKWMEDAEVEDLTRETIHNQYELIRTETNTSHVEEYGDLDLGSMVLSLFLGHSDKNAKAIATNSHKKLSPLTDAVDSRDVPLKILYKKLKATGNGTAEEKDIKFKIHQMQKYRRTADSIVNNLVRLVAKDDRDLVELFSDKDYQLNKKNLRCYEQSITYFDEKCFKLAKNPYLGKHLYKFINMCSTKKTHLKNIRAAIDEACKGVLLTGIA